MNKLKLERLLHLILSYEARTGMKAPSKWYAWGSELFLRLVND